MMQACIMSAQNPGDDDVDVAAPALHCAEGSVQTGPRLLDDNRGFDCEARKCNADKTLLRCSVNQSCPAAGTQHGDEFTEAQDFTQLPKLKDHLASLTHGMLDSKVLNHFEDQQNDLDEGPDSPLHTALNSWDEEIHRKHPPLQEEIPHRPLHKTLTTKGRNQHVQRDKFVQGQHHRNDPLSQGKIPSCPPHGTVKAKEHYQYTDKDKDKDLDGILSHHMQRDIVDSPLPQTPKVRTKATHFQGQGSGMAEVAILQSGLTHRNSRIPSLDTIVNKLRTVNKSKEEPSLETDAEPDKDSSLLGAAVNVSAEASTSSRATKGMLSGGFYSCSLDARDFLNPAPHGHASQPSCFLSKERVGASKSSKRKHCSREMPHLKRTEKSVENDLVEKKCLVVENLVVGEALVASASSDLVLEKPVPFGQQCALCKEYVPQASLNSHRCKVGVSKTKLPIPDGESSGKSQIQESYQCKVCERPFTEENGDGKKQLICRECAGRMDHSESVSVSENVVRGIHKCDRCEQSFSSRSNLSLHLLSHVKVKMHKCDECDKNFRTEGLLTTHKRIHAGQHPYQCHICDRTFGKSNTLTCHLRTHSGEKPYQCNLCDKSFTQNSALTVHKRIHSGEQPFCCELCGKNFRDKSNLRRHVRTHSGDQPFECTVCGKRFSTKDHLNTHFRIHTGDRPYQCNMCDKAFTQSSTLVGHLRTHTGELPLRCDVCHKAFRDRNSYSTHMKLHAEDSKWKSTVSST